MKLHFLGHSEFIVEMENPAGRPVRILFDSWLSDFAFGDFLARNPRIVPDWKKFPQLDAVYLSHPHCDHFDPYTLKALFETQRPVILLPETIEFTAPILQEYLDQPEIFLLHDRREVKFQGLTLFGRCFSQAQYTNEDDVMTLFAASDREIFFTEVDAAIPETVEAYTEVHDRFAAKDYDTRVYAATRNELEALYLALDTPLAADRRRKIKQYVKHRRLEMEREFSKFDDDEDGTPEIWKLPRMVRMITGQGLVFPGAVDAGREKASAPFPLADVVTHERETAKNFKRRLGIHAHEPGLIFDIRGMEIKKSKIGYAEFSPLDFSGGDAVQLTEDTLDRPVVDEVRDEKNQEDRILAALNQRFLPFQTAHRSAPMKDLLLGNEDRRYIVRIRYGTSEKNHAVLYAFRFGRPGFERIPNVKRFDESYWANDVDDFLEGRQDMFSTTLHHFISGTRGHFWACLGMPFLNSDLVDKKIRLHFERASHGDDAAGWVLPRALANVVQKQA